MKRCDQCGDFLIPGEFHWIDTTKRRKNVYCGTCRDFANRYTAMMFGNRLRREASP